MELTKEQRDAVDHISGHLQIIACAGSGKTEVISRRIANILGSQPNVLPENIVAFTFTEKAAESLKSRIEKVLGKNVDGMYIGTIHGFCKYLLSKYTEQFAKYRVLDSVKNHLFVSRYADHCGMKDLELAPCMLNNNLFLQCIDKLIDDYDRRENWTQLQREVLDKYINCLYSHRYIDFSLLIFEALRQIEENAALQAYLSTIQYLVVDEYQDVNDLQEKLIASIAAAGANVCVVGDDDQTIYQFRGSNADNMITFAERYPEVCRVQLMENFRCQKSIVDLADNVIKQNTRRLAKQMLSGAKEADSTACAKGYSSPEAECAAIANHVEQLYAQGIPYHEMAVLTRKGKHIVPIAKELEAKEIPYHADSAEDFFTGAYFSRFVETLRVLENNDKAALYEQWQGLTDSAQFNKAFKYLRSCARGGNQHLSDILKEFCEMIAFLDENAVDLQTRQEDLHGMITILDDYEEIYGDYQLSARISGVLRFLGTQAAQEYKYHSFREASAEEDAVQLMTVHKSKGLEFHTVFLPQLNKREFPVSNLGGRKYYHVLGGTFVENKSKYEADIEDERKLFYVAVTRAKQNLFLSYTLEKQPVSIFVKEAAASQYLDINRADLNYNPKADAYDYPTGYHSSYTGKSYEASPEREEERRQKQEYWAAVKYARSQLYDYYGTACHFFPAAHGDLMRIKSMSPDEILREASENRLI